MLIYVHDGIEADGLMKTISKRGIHICGCKILSDTLFYNLVGYMCIAFHLFDKWYDITLYNMWN